ncbi:MAG: heavy metal translocating P-type ATPase [Fretibacterium sp.]|nr:heavy metal translocating P-type ATPase [Fretibacterium sp.]
MEYVIEHELPGRLRLRCHPGSFNLAESRIIAAILETQPGVASVAASHRTGSLLINYTEEDGGGRDFVLKAVSLLDKSYYEGIDGNDLPGKTSGAEESLGKALTRMLTGVVIRSLLPAGLHATLSVFRALPFLRRGAGSLFRSLRPNVAVLDASAVGVSLMRKDFRTASVIMTLLRLGDTLEEWTHRKSKESLAGSLALHIDKLWIRQDGQELQIPASELKIGNLVVVRAGSVIPVDGVVDAGDGMVDQSSMTGESEAVHRGPGLSVYAGTVLEEGELVIRVTAFDSETRVMKIADMIDESEELKAVVQNRAEKMADAIVPWSFLVSGATWLVTGNIVRATAALMVDYSCALKLSTPLAVLSAMREGTKHGILIKGGRFMETVAAADTFVFDKTGTLTVSTPSVAKVIPFGSWERDEVLRTAACLEEHFPHSIARAVVRQAEIESLQHHEKHSTVEYLAAHGIVSRIGDERLLLGSAHFIFEDNGVIPTPEQQKIIDGEANRYSILYLAAGERLAGILCIEDPLRPDARDTVRHLHNAGVRRIVMLTGDNKRVARSVADKLEVDDVRAQLLPEDKTRIVEELKEESRGVVMVGDGVNDSPALAAADVGVSMKSGADIAREVADLVLTENRLGAIMEARRLGEGMMRKIYRNYTFIVGANSLLLALGVCGVISPAVSALLHNLATVGSGVYALTPILPGEPLSRRRSCRQDDRELH